MFLQVSDLIRNLFGLLRTRYIFVKIAVTKCIENAALLFFLNSIEYLDFPSICIWNELFNLSWGIHV